jgi:hypothetical protein
VTGAETHDYGRSREHDISVEPWAGAYMMTKRVEVDPDEEHDGKVPVLRHRQAHHSLRHFEIPYKNEQHEYCPATA